MINIYVGSDHGGFELKSSIVNHFKDIYNMIDEGCYDSNRCDYPDIANTVCNKVLQDEKSIGILFCGSGIGMSIAANKINSINCALCNDVYCAEMAKKHNNANIISIGARIVNQETSIAIINKFVMEEFEGNRHQVRIDKIKLLELSN